MLVEIDRGLWRARERLTIGEDDRLAVHETPRTIGRDPARRRRVAGHEPGRPRAAEVCRLRELSTRLVGAVHARERRAVAEVACALRARHEDPELGASRRAAAVGLDLRI